MAEGECLFPGDEDGGPTLPRGWTGGRSQTPEPPTPALDSLIMRTDPDGRTPM